MKKFTDDMIRKVVELYDLGFGVRSISHLIPEISESYVEQILEGRARVAVTGGRVINGRKICRSDAARRGWERKRWLERGQGIVE